MKKMFLILCLLCSHSLYALNCNEQQHALLEERLSQFFKKNKVIMTKPTTIFYNCYVEKEDTKPWDNNVALTFPITFKDLPFSDKKTGCNYWTHAKKGYIRCAIKRPKFKTDIKEPELP